MASLQADCVQCQTQNACSVKLQDWSVRTEEVYALHQSDTLHREKKNFKRRIFCLKDAFYEVPPTMTLDCGGFCSNNINLWSS